MKRIITVFIVFTLFVSLSSISVSANVAASNDLPKVSSDGVKNPIFSHQAGFYAAEFDLALSTDEPDTKLYFTTDGSDPIPGNKSTIEYSGPIEIKSRIGDPNILSLIDTAHPDYDAARTTPKNEVFKCTIIKATASRKDGVKSEVITKSYFVDKDMKTRYNVPVLSLVTDYNNLFDEKTGIYTSLNCVNKGSEWERPMHIEFFEPDGSLGFSQNIGTRINGGFTRVFPQKPLRLYADEKYDTLSKFKYDIFQGKAKNADNKTIDSFKRLVLRNGGNDWQGVMMRDALIHSIVSHLNVETQAYRPSVLFLNGEYWGVYNIRERYDGQYLKSHYNLDKDKVAILDVFESPDLQEGTQDDINAYFKDIVNYLKENSITDKNTYDQLKTKMDIDSFIDYNITHIFIGNNDWPGNNVSIWKYKTDDGKYHPEAPKGQDGRWRWIVRDTDFGLGIWEKSPEHNTLGFALGKFTESGMEYANAPWAVFILKSLLNNDEFRNKFINRFADHLNTTFTAKRVTEKIDIAKAAIEKEMPEHYDRWNVSWLNMSYFQSNTSYMKYYAQERPEIVRKQIINEFSDFGIEGKATIKITSDSTKGFVKVNTIDIKDSTPGVENQSEWSGVYFKGVPVTIKAMPKEGFEFFSWSGINNISQKSDTITFIPAEDMNITAIYKTIGGADPTPKPTIYVTPTPTITSTPTSSPTPSISTEEYFYGDFNDDKIVDSADYTLLRKELLGIISTDPDNNNSLYQKRVDVNGDKTIDIADYAYLRRFLLNKISEFPVGIKFNPKDTKVRYKDTIFSDIKVDKNIAYKDAVNFYGENEKQLLDVYRPEGDAEKKRPVCLYVHGGSLYTGSKDDQPWANLLSENFAKKGYVCVSINYRLIPDPDNNWNRGMNDAMSDIVSAIDWIKANSDKYGMDKNNIILSGYSAGAEMISNLIYGTHIDGWDRSGITGVVDVAGNRLFWGDALKASAPCLIIHGTADNINPFSDCKIFVEQLKKGGIDYKLEAIEGEDHFFRKADTLSKIDDMITEFCFSIVSKK